MLLVEMGGKGLANLVLGSLSGWTLVTCSQAMTSACLSCNGKGQWRCTRWEAGEHGMLFLEVGIAGFPFGLPPGWSPIICITSNNDLNHLSMWS